MSCTNLLLDAATVEEVALVTAPSGEEWSLLQKPLAPGTLPTTRFISLLERMHAAKSSAVWSLTVHVWTRYFRLVGFTRRAYPSHQYLSHGLELSLTMKSGSMEILPDLDPERTITKAWLCEGENGQ